MSYSLKVLKKIRQRFIKILSVFSRKRSKNNPQPSFTFGWSGNFLSWEEASLQCSSYESEIILNKCFESILKVHNGLAKYERDSVLFDKIEYSTGLLSGLLLIALKEKKINILDFGGSLGTSYYQNRSILNDIEVSWSIVEQPKFVEIGRNHLGGNNLKFYGSIANCVIAESPNAILFSGVLQYLENPKNIIDEILKYSFKYIIIDRTAFVCNPSHILTIQRVPPSIYEASYPAWFFNETVFMSYFEGYELLLDFENNIDPPGILNEEYKVYWKGYILRKHE